MAGEEAEPNFKRFLHNVRKEKISFVAFGMPIPNAELERVIKYYERGHATTHDIAKAWPYRNPTKKELSFELHGPFKWELFFFHFYGFLCVVALVIVTIGTGKSIEKASTASFEDLIPFGITLAVLWLFITVLARKNEGLLTAARLAKLEKAGAKDPSPIDSE